jgi:hypothetical protein
LEILEEIDMSEKEWIIPSIGGLPTPGVTDPVTHDYIDYFCTMDFGGKRTTRLMKFDEKGRWMSWGTDYTDHVVAWMPTPKPYMG